ncbi:glycosyltransferase [Aliivibrio fischeri]|uniref:glycosyltransferase n=1 Tax=Aliivibrio fischeri TaxID=668 RepID=UPI001305D68D|nr:glycosyltransferase [Aliivibrio fischeri]
MKRIVFYRPSLFCGGAERVIVNKANFYSSLGYDVHIILKKNIIEFELDKNINIHVLFEIERLSYIRSFLERILGYLYYLISSILISYKLKLIVKKIEENQGAIDCIFIHSNKAFMEAMNFNHEKKIVICHSNKSALYNSSEYRYKRFIANKVAQTTLKKEKKIVCVSNGIKDDLISNFNIDESFISVIYNPFDLEDIKEKSLAFPVTLNKPYIVHVGRLSKEKRHEDLIDIFHLSQIKDTHKLLVIGDGIERNFLENYVKKLGLNNSIIFIGRVDNPYPYIKSADLLILSSEYEGFGNVLVEASALNTPAISSDCNYGPKEIIKNEYLYPVYDIQEGARLLHKTLNNINGSTGIYDVSIYSTKQICGEYLKI